MKIDTDFRGAARRNIVVLSGEVMAVISVTQLQGLQKGKDIFLPPNSIVDSLGNYCHEVGHILGTILSFQAGLNGVGVSQVISFDEAKNPDLTVELTRPERNYLKWCIFSDDIVPLDEAVVSVAHKLLEVFTKGIFDPGMVVLHKVSQKELERIASSERGSTLHMDSNGNMANLNSKEGRNIEIPAYVVQFCCMQILENTLRRYGIFSENDYFRFYRKDSRAHQRAQNIVARALMGKGWRIPSSLDLRNRAV